MNNFNDFTIEENTYYNKLSEYLNAVKNSSFEKVYHKTKKGGYFYLNIPAAFDIETSSFYEDGEKRAIMYIWQFSLNGHVMIGRTWDAFIKLLQGLKTYLMLSEDRRLVVYVHNLSYEFQFMRKWISWDNVFSTDIRKPVYALSEYDIEFRDSYILSGYSLQTVGNNLQKYHVKKLVGNLDYEVIRTPIMPLTDNEIAYCINDVLVVSAYIQECIEEYGNINKIPLTQTGKVRKYCRKKCYEGFSKNPEMKMQTGFDYKNLMSMLTITPREYALLKLSFQGGFTHANARFVGDMMENVSSYDFTSSYPYVMVSEKFPMGKGFEYKPKTFADYEKMSNQFLMVFVLKMFHVKPKIFADNPISKSRCLEYKEITENNGRIAYAEELVIPCTNIDFDIYRDFYDYDRLEIGTCYCYAKDYLPRNFVLSILKLYNDKTQLKGVSGKEKEYQHGKEMLNSCYGMCVTDIIRDDIIYNNEWGKSPANVEEQIDKYNKSRNRFLFYPWGVFVTAYARRNLFSGIRECNQDYIYADTDSVKIINGERHKEYFEKYNNDVITKLNRVSNARDIPIELFIPKTIKGIEKPLGVWDFEGIYPKFKTLGAKRYLYLDEDNNLHSTVAGVNKKGLSQYLKDTYNTDEEIFHAFEDGLIVPEDYTGKLTHTYIDNEMRGKIKGFQYYEKSGIHLSKTEYEMSLSDLFIRFLKGVKNTQYEI